ncbi:MAG: preprotein translocase subunit SecE [Gammaproteobacteria bacterium]|nr:preprotein translocase subunit SecE [Gammaproteobacteria bacterium]
MSSKVEPVSGKLDPFKIAASLILVAGGIAAFYVFSAESLLLRVIGLILCAAAAAYIALQTEAGRTFLAFFQEAQTEVRRVVWPTKQETVHTTGVVIVVVVVFAIVMWILDLALGAGIQSIIGQGG